MPPTRSQQAAAKVENGARRQLPSTKFNTMLVADTAIDTLVKFQVIRKEGRSIVVGRVKVPTPVGHAYVLRRYDTGFISLTTMWKAAFPSATSTQEKEEAAWVKANHEISGPPEAARLAGVWLPVPIAKIIAKEYSLDEIVESLARTSPDPNLVVPADTAAAPEAAAAPAKPETKRRKASVPRSTDKQPQTRASAAANTLPTPTTPGRVTRSTKSPAASSARGITKSPVAAKTTRASKAASAAHHESEAEAEPEVPGVDPEEDIAESQDLVSRLKAEINGISASPQTTTKRVKRTREEELPNGKSPIKLDLEVVPEESPREIATNSRVNQLVRWPSLPSVPSLPTLQPNQKSAAWGTLAFALAVGATTFVPQFF